MSALVHRSSCSSAPRACAQQKKGVHPTFASASYCLARAPRSAAAQGSSRQAVVVRAAAAEEKEVIVNAPANASTSSSSWIPVCRMEDLPKGVRKEVSVDGQAILLFWYRGQPYAIEARSPAEGAYSEGFLQAKFTQDYCIECPSTGSLFSLKDGSIVSWYPKNPVLRALTPASLCRPLAVYPVRYGPDAVYVDVEAASALAGGGVAARADRGGAGTSAEGNNVFTVQPSVYFEGQDPSVESASLYAASGPGGKAAEKLNPATVAVGAAALGIVAVAGTATAIYYESQLALGLFWLVLGGGVGVAGYRYVNGKAE